MILGCFLLLLVELRSSQAALAFPSAGAATHGEKWDLHSARVCLYLEHLMHPVAGGGVRHGQHLHKAQAVDTYQLLGVSLGERGWVWVGEVLLLS